MEYNYQIIYTAQFESDLDSIADYFCNTLMNPSAYLNLTDRIKRQKKMLRTFPKSFIDFESNFPLKYCYKTFHVGNYTAFFCIDENEHIVYVRRILYSGMDLKSMFI